MKKHSPSILTGYDEDVFAQAPVEFSESQDFQSEALWADLGYSVIGEETEYRTARLSGQSYSPALEAQYYQNGLNKFETEKSSEVITETPVAAPVAVEEILTLAAIGNVVTINGESLSTHQFSRRATDPTYRAYSRINMSGQQASKRARNKSSRRGKIN